MLSENVNVVRIRIRKNITVDKKIQYISSIQTLKIEIRS
jgi:hypothetical protein